MSASDDWIAAGGKVTRGPDRYSVPSQHGTRKPDLTPAPKKPGNGGGFGKMWQKRRAMARGIIRP